jgi:SAM-dependent methyltransferase
LTHRFLNLGSSPPSNAYLTEKNLSFPETYFPLMVMVCDQCWLVQTCDYAQADELFNSDYAYFSSTSSSWLSHAELYTAQMVHRFSLSSNSMVIEVASNDGYLLKNFVAAGIPCLGIEPTESTAMVAESKGIPVLREFFGEALGKRLSFEGKKADLIAGNNVYAHVPDINDFTRGLKAALKQGGTITLEFPHLMRLIDDSQFDTVYHEHFSYLSLYTVTRIFHSAGLRVWDVEEIPTHGGSLRIYGCHDNDLRETSHMVNKILETESIKGMRSIETYMKVQRRADEIKNNFLDFLITAKRENKKVVAYGAAAKGNTLLNYAGVKPDLLPLVCDASPSKQGKYMPGSRIPILSPEKIYNEKPDYIIILPWNIAKEVITQLKSMQKSGSKFVIAIPHLSIIE